jgi:DNA invertase Pin-like site-specific DNA recombinase
VIPAAAYFRVSNEDLTIENQRAEVFRMAEARGYSIADHHVYTDELSGAAEKRDRPGIEALMTAAARGKFRAAFVWALDRFSRDGSFTGGLLMVGELDRYRTALLSYSETWLDTAGPFREPLVAIALKLAEQ